MNCNAIRGRIRNWRRGSIGPALLPLCVSLLLVNCAREPSGPSNQPLLVTITTPSPTIEAVGDTIRLSATARDLNGAAATIGFTWSSSDVSIASVDASGLVRAHAKGSVIITAHSARGSGTVAIVVTAAAVNGILGAVGGVVQHNSGTSVEALPGAIDGIVNVRIETIPSPWPGASLFGNVLSFKLTPAGRSAASHSNDLAAPFMLRFNFKLPRTITDIREAAVRVVVDESGSLFYPVFPQLAPSGDIVS